MKIAETIGMELLPSQMEHTDLARTQFFIALFHRGWPYLVRTQHETERPVLPVLESLGECWVLKDHPLISVTAIAEDYAVYARQTPSRTDIHVAAASLEKAEERVAALKAVLEPTPEIAGSVSAHFWYQGHGGGTDRVRRIVVPRWEEIAGNYTRSARDALAVVMQMRPPFPGGQLVLFHGPPGTGKTYCVRALFDAWKDWCVPNYIIDPEDFFGKANYMLSATLGRTGDDDDDYDSYGEGVATRDKWKVFVVEDADEYLSIDAKTRGGQAFARILNLADGLIGQGLRILLLMTTNEPIDRLHEAVSRSGRCLANVEFGLLSASETREWSAQHGQPPPGRSMRLADLYNRSPVADWTPRQRVGFGAGVKTGS